MNKLGKGPLDNAKFQTKFQAWKASCSEEEDFLNIYLCTRKVPALCAGRHKVLQTFLQGCVTLQNYSKPLNSTISGRNL